MVVVFDWMCCLFIYWIKLFKTKYDIPTNDAEYAWILNVLNFDKNRDPKKVHPISKINS